MPRVLFGVTVAMTAQAFLRDQLSALAQQGWEVHLACSDDDGTDSFQKLQQLENVTLHRLSMTRRPHPLRDALSLWGWLCLIRDVKPQLVISSTPKAGLLGMVAAFFLRIQVRIYHIRGLRAEGLVGAMALVSRASERIAIGAATDVLIDSSSLMETMRAQDLLPESKGEVLGAGSCCGVDIDWFRPPTPTERHNAREAIGLSNEDIVIGFLGRVAVDKGIRELVEASEALHAEYPRVRLVIVGPVEDPSELNELLREIRSMDWAVMLDSTDDSRLMYWAFDVYCLPSYREGFPIAPLEAQACGLPVVTTNATGCVDSIESNRTGLSVPRGDCPTLISALSELIESERVRKRMGAAGRNRVVQHFSSTIVKTRFINYLIATLNEN